MVSGNKIEMQAEGQWLLGKRALGQALPWGELHPHLHLRKQACTWREGRGGKQNSSSHHSQQSRRSHNVLCTSASYTEILSLLWVAGIGLRGAATPIKTHSSFWAPSGIRVWTAQFHLLKGNCGPPSATGLHGWGIWPRRWRRSCVCCPHPVELSGVGMNVVGGPIALFPKQV